MKEEISVYFRMAFRDGRCGAGYSPAWMGSGKRPALWAVAAGEGREHPSRNSMETASLPLTSVRLRATVVQVRIRNFIHKGLKKLYTDDATKGVPPDTVDKFRKMLAFLDDMEDPEELRMLPSWKAHTLTGDRKGAWSLSVTANRRLTFRIDTTEREIYDVNLEDYH